MRRQLAKVICNFNAGFVLSIPLSLMLAMSPAFAQQSARWTADETLARADVPISADMQNIKTATLSCEAQKWSLLLEMNEKSSFQQGNITFGVDRSSFETKALAKQNVLGIRVPHDALEKLKNGIRLTVNLPEPADETTETSPVSFSLRGSKIAINAMEEKCSQRDMSEYQAVSFTPFSSYAMLAEDLRKKDIESFKTATFSNPVLTVAMAEFGEGKRVLFTRLCGSSWYYGRSGCNVTGFAQLGKANDQTAIEGWSAIYDSENVALHINEKSKSQGWPDLVTLPARTAGNGEIWRWKDHSYKIHAELPAEEDDGLPLFPSQ